MMRSSLLTLLLLASAPLHASGTPAVTAPLQAEAKLDLKSEIDRSIRWLRSKQSPDGSYGGSVKSTAWVLQCLAQSPRMYVRRDGPFIAGALDYLAAHQNPTNGGIYDKGANEVQRTAQSALAWLALSQYDDPKSQAIAEKVQGFFQVPLSPSKGEPLTREAAEKELAQWLARRHPDGSWEGPEGSLIRTAEGVIALTRCRKALEPKSATPTSAKPLPAFSKANRDATVHSMHKGALFLIATSDKGLWGAPGKPDMGITSMALGALQELPAPRPREVQQVIDNGLQWLARHQDADGAIHDGKLKNYLTSASILALAKSGDAQYAPAIEKARKFLVRLQADEGEGYTDGDLYYGGIGYGGDERPDLSNLQMALEAMSAAGMEKGNESFTRALKYLERTQNRSESNDVNIVDKGVVIRSGDDGGAGYAPADSKAGFVELPDGSKVPRSYGSMTYALLKGFIFAGLPKDDPRMQAAWKWLGENYTLDVNPGFEATGDPTAPYKGLFYYFHTMSKALDLYGEEIVVDAAGREHAWRTELCGRLIAMQRRDDGSWLNENAPSWWEGNPVLATSYALLTLGNALPDK